MHGCCSLLPLPLIVNCNIHKTKMHRCAHSYFMVNFIFPQCDFGCIAFVRLIASPKFVLHFNIILCNFMLANEHRTFEAIEWRVRWTITSINSEDYIYTDFFCVPRERAKKCKRKRQVRHLNLLFATIIHRSFSSK